MPRGGASNEYPQHMFLLRNKKNIPTKILSFEPVHDKTYNNTCVTSKDLDQPVHPPSIARVFIYPLRLCKAHAISED